MRWAPIILLVGACVTPRLSLSYPDCVLDHRIQARNVDDCQRLNLHIEKARHSFNKHVPGWSFEVSSTRFQGWHIYARHDFGSMWTDLWRRDIAGITFCESKTIIISSEDWEYLPHELAHAMQCGQKLPHCHPRDIPPEHCGWFENKIWKAIYEAKILVD